MKKMYTVVTTFSREIDIDQCTKTSTSISHYINIIKRKISLKQLFTKKISGQKILPCPDTRAGQVCPVTVSGVHIKPVDSFYQ